MAVDPIPPGFHTVTPYLVVEGADKLMSFLKDAFAAEEVLAHKGPDGGIMHAEMRIGTSMIMLSEARAENPAMPCMLYLYVEDVDRSFRAAVAAGGKPIKEPEDQFYGDRSGGITDPCGIQWWIGTHIKDVSEQELARRFQNM